MTIEQMLEALITEYDVPMYDEESQTQVMIPERHEPEIWFVGNLWHVRSDSWAETYRHPELVKALAAVIAGLPEEERKQISRLCGI